MGKVNETFAIKICFTATCEVQKLYDLLASTVTLTCYVFVTQSWQHLCMYNMHITTCHIYRCKFFRHFECEGHTNDSQTLRII